MPNPDFLRLIAYNEQDRAEGLQWWRESSTAEKMAVWEMIQRPFSNPIMEIMSRLAQLAFTEMAEREGLGE